jgi:uncharacterized membrane protein
MNKLITPGRIIFSIGMIALGCICFISKDFIVGRPPAWPTSFEVNPALAYISGTILVLAAIAVLIKKKGAYAALLIAALIFLLSILRHLTHFMSDWLNTYKAMALCGGTLIIAASFFREDVVSLRGNNTKRKLINVLISAGCILIAAFFIAGGYAHFKFAEFVKDFIPAYIPFRAFWTYFCGICLVAGGLGLIIPPTRRLAALLSGIMIGGWFILLHIPRFLANTKDASDRMGLCESFAFTGILFVLAGMLRKLTIDH